MYADTVMVRVYPIKGRLRTIPISEKRVTDLAESIPEKIFFFVDDIEEI